MGWLEEFKKFIQRGNVVDLAVAVIIGAAFTGIVNSLVNDVFTPLLGIAATGNDVLSVMDIEIYEGVKIKIGAFVRAIFNFFIVAFCVFWLVKALNILYLQKLLAAETKPPELTTQEKLLTEIRDLLKGKQESANSQTDERPV